MRGGIKGEPIRKRIRHGRSDNSHGRYNISVERKRKEGSSDLLLREVQGTVGIPIPPTLAKKKKSFVGYLRRKNSIWQVERPAPKIGAGLCVKETMLMKIGKRHD